MKTRNICGLAPPLLALALLTAGSARALEEAPEIKPQAKTQSEAPVARTIRFQSTESISFKQRLEIYNRAKADSDKLHCREDRMTGSHRKKMRCVTLATKRLEEDAARAFFRALR